MVELLQNTSNLKKVQDKDTQFLLIYLFLFLKLPLSSLRKIKILRVLIFLTIYSLSDEDSVIEVMKGFHKFSLANGLKPNEAKCEIAYPGVMKGVSLALCGMDCIDLTKKTIK